MYLALAFCLVAIAIAALFTYVSLTDFINENEVDGDNVLLEYSEADSQIEEDEESSLAEESSLDEEINEENPADDEVNAVPYTCTEEFLYPVGNSEITTGYSCDTLIYNETMKDYRLHNAVDFSANEGDSVYSANNGIVLDVYYDLLLGNVVVIEHGEYIFYYCGLEVSINVGDVVSIGDELGVISVVPYESESFHLHLEVKVNEEYINPLSVNFTE